MGALTVIRKRASEFFGLYDSSPSESIDFSNYSLYSNQIDTNVLKKRRISCLNQVKLESSALRLQKYPESVRKVRREVHAPCRSRRFGFLSSSKNAGLKVRVSETPEKEGGIMGNVFGSGGGLFRTYQAKKEAAFGALRHLQVGKEVVEKEEVVSEDSSEVVIIEKKEGKEGEGEGEKVVSFRHCLDRKKGGKGRGGRRREEKGREGEERRGRMKEMIFPPNLAYVSGEIICLVGRKLKDPFSIPSKSLYLHFANQTMDFSSFQFPLLPFFSNPSIQTHP